MEIQKDEIITKIHDSYDEYESTQFIVELAINDTLEIKANDQPIKTFTAKYVNCHINVTIQDKGVKHEPTELELLKAQRDGLNEQIAEEENK